MQFESVVPPVSVPFVRSRFPTVNVPSPRVHQIGPRKERDLLQHLTIQIIEILLRVRLIIGKQSNSLKFSITVNKEEFLFYDIHPTLYSDALTVLTYIQCTYTRFNNLFYLQVLRRRHRQRHCIADSFVESWIGAFPECDRLNGVLQIILDVPHLVMNRNQIIHIHRRAHLDPIVSSKSHQWRY